jgi:hypothetical protein
LSFRLSDKMSEFKEDWKKVYRLLNNFDWNLQFVIGERSYFASPSFEVLMQILHILNLDSSLADHTETILT